MNNQPTNSTNAKAPFRGLGVVNCFLACNNTAETLKTVEQLKQSSLIQTIYLLVKSGNNIQLKDCHTIEIDSLQSSETIRKIAAKADTAYSLIYTKDTTLELGQFAVERFYHIASDTQAGLVYSDYYEIKDGVRSNLPVIDYQEGSLRDDFNFGSVLFYDSEYLEKAAAETSVNYQFAGLYNLRLKVSQQAELVHINEYLYSEVENDTRKSGEKQFDYVDPKNRAVQLEMEVACTDHLRKIGAYLAPQFKTISFDESNFPVEASIIIPIRNRVKTVEDAIKSVLMQKTTFDFNLIIIDNFSTDGTSELIEKYAKTDSRVIHLTPNRNDLGIGGCWNEGVHSAYCGKFAVQLDSDDVYQTENTLQTVVDAFYEQNCAMVIGSYTMTNFAMETIAPGLIDHKEWTPENGRNNALRINGLGAPRAFYTPVLRDIKVPNTSYGEDYALGLRISREYQIGRIYDSLYLCRRWDENSDASLDVVKMNGHNLYKDKIRTVELKARKS
ncbi:glycosyl transferase family 2 [Paludibacter propionicigenes WB4]|uniref:Glycosyl transferase family 2 n=1 Tax=Paludibacter propionicigenes (strain DSM 17365 / JCM 13257 / WB4) TaxID=694427 RepID=E4T7Z2_PALPW|nr:glycosyltransferase family A protein [Paludibacter propionicigenes]ADQ80836.1 glycosyl transferase family 2 [Paludibacter propionicigenes WB4]